MAYNFFCQIQPNSVKSLVYVVHFLPDLEQVVSTARQVIWLGTRNSVFFGHSMANHRAIKSHGPHNHPSYWSISEWGDRETCWGITYCRGHNSCLDSPRCDVLAMFCHGSGVFLIWGAVAGSHDQFSTKGRWLGSDSEYTVRFRGSWEERLHNYFETRLRIKWSPQTRWKLRLF